MMLVCHLDAFNKLTKSESAYESDEWKGQQMSQFTTGCLKSWPTLSLICSYRRVLSIGHVEVLDQALELCIANIRPV